MERPSRKNIRLAGYDYSSQGGYFITICTHGRRCLLSRILPGTATVHAEVVLSELGKIAAETLHQLARDHGLTVDTYVIMPDHIHIILFLPENAPCNIGRFLGAFKSLTATRWYKVCDRLGVTAGKIWQRNYYDHILRNEADHLEKRKYIEENPDKWHPGDQC